MYACPEKQVEEGRGTCFVETASNSASQKAVNYPIGKPLEVTNTYFVAK